MPSMPSRMSPRRRSISRAFRARVLRGERERVGRDVQRGDSRAGMLLGEREGDGSRSGADVEDARRSRSVEECERSLDEELRLGARHERATVAAQGEPAEVPVAEHVREGLALTAAGDEGAARGELVRGERAVERGVELDRSTGRAPARGAAPRRGAATRRLCARGTPWSGEALPPVSARATPSGWDMSKSLAPGHVSRGHRGLVGTCLCTWYGDMSRADRVS